MPGAYIMLRNVTSITTTPNFQSVQRTKNYNELFLLNLTLFCPSDPVSGF